MRRLTLWLMTGVTGWLAFRSLRAEAKAAVPLADARAKPSGETRGHSAPLREAARERRHRGRTADSPAEIPPRGWKDILLRTYRSLSEDRVTALAAGVTYYVLLALFPGVTALVSIYGLIADPADIGEHLASLSGAIPSDAISIISGQLHYLAAQDPQVLGLAFFAGLLVSLWSANAAMKALFDALNVVYGEKEKRNFLVLNTLSLAFTAGLVLFLVIAMIGIVVIPAVLDLLYLGSVSEVIINLLRWPAMLALVVLGLAVLYRYGPSRADARWRWISGGSVGAALLWLLVSMLFSWYASNFGSYNKTYGSLGARGAKMADTVGAAQD